MVIKEQIMLTAFDLFSEHGIKNVSMDDIAHNASISKRTLYELFEDKETLLTRSYGEAITISAPAAWMFISPNYANYCKMILPSGL